MERERGREGLLILGNVYYDGIFYFVRSCVLKKYFLTLFCYNFDQELIF